jgi:hypothetical protein
MPRTSLDLVMQSFEHVLRVFFAVTLQITLVFPFRQVWFEGALFHLTIFNLIFLGGAGIIQ